MLQEAQYSGLLKRNKQIARGWADKSLHSPSYIFKEVIIYGRSIKAWCDPAAD
jgi:hypothetical protein